MHKHSAIYFILFLLLFAVPIRAQTPELSYERYDVEITLHDDASFSVREIQHIRFRDRFRTGFAEIPRGLVGDISNVRVSGGDSMDTVSPYVAGGEGPFSYRVELEQDAVFVEWEFFPTDVGDEKIFVVEYEVSDALWVYPDAHRLEWRAVPAEREGIVVRESRVTVNLPFAEPTLTLEAFGPDYTMQIMETAAAQQITFIADGPIESGTPFQVLVDFAPGLVPAQLQPWQIAEDTAALAYTLDSVDVTLDLQADGRLTVTEEQAVTVESGVMYSGFRDVTLLYVDEIAGWQIGEGERPFTAADSIETCEDCFAVTETSRSSGWVRFSEVRDEIEISERLAGASEATWRFSPLVRGESTTFMLQFTADGVLRINENGTQELVWTVLPGYDAPVEQTAVRLILPGRLALEDVQISGGTARYAEDDTILITPLQPIAAGAAWQIGLTLPPNATTATKPTWQHELEARFVEAARARARQARVDLAWLVGKIGAGLTAVLAAITIWYLWGSRKLRERLGNYRTTPPSNLPPGLVAYLVEGKATSQGALASLLHLADLGLLRVRVQDEGLQLVRVQEAGVVAGQTAAAADGASVTVTPHAAVLFNGLHEALPVGEAVSLTQIMPTLRVLLPSLYAAMAGEMGDYFYGDARDAARRRLVRALPLIWFGVSVVTLWLTLQSGRRVPFRGPNFFPAIVIVFGGFVAMGFFTLVSQRSPESLSKLGREEADRWRGFRAYLQEIAQLGNWPEAQHILDRYFAYAVALGVEKRLLQQAAALGAQPPRWLGDGRSAQRHQESAWRRAVRRGSWLPQPANVPPPAASLPSTSIPQPVPANGRGGLQGVSDGLTQALAGANTHLTSLLETAVGNGVEPLNVVIKAAGQQVKLDWEPGTPLDQVMRDIMQKTESGVKPPRPASGSGRGGYRGGGRGGRSSGRSSSRSSRRSSRRSSSRRSGGGGRRGFRK